jgi:hypothetical protein
MGLENQRLMCLNLTMEPPFSISTADLPPLMHDMGDAPLGLRPHPRLSIPGCIEHSDFTAVDDGPDSTSLALAASAVSPSSPLHASRAKPIMKLRLSLDLRSGGEWVGVSFRTAAYSHVYRTVRDAIALKRAVDPIWSQRFDEFIHDEVAEYVSIYSTLDKLINNCVNRWIPAPAGPGA